MLNLISNSIEAMEGISSADRSLTVKSTTHGSEWIVVSVIDAGPGLRPEDSKRVFEAFFSTKPAGMGLGLRSARPSLNRTAESYGHLRMELKAVSWSSNCP
jgi:signal transduction histidine kinase